MGTACRTVCVYQTVHPLFDIGASLLLLRIPIYSIFRLQSIKKFFYATYILSILDKPLILKGYSLVIDNKGEGQ